MEIGDAFIFPVRRDFRRAGRSRLPGKKPSGDPESCGDRTPKLRRFQISPSRNSPSCATLSHRPVQSPALLLLLLAVRDAARLRVDRSASPPQGRCGRAARSRVARRGVWQVVVPLGAGANAVTLQALNHADALVGSAPITITNNGPNVPAAELQAGFTSADDFEFIERMSVDPNRTGGITLAIEAGARGNVTSPALVEPVPAVHPARHVRWRWARGNRRR